MPQRSKSSVPPALAALLGLSSLAGCQSYLQSNDSIFGFITPYRLEVVQGNVVTKEQAEQVKAGMSRAQVRDILGSPLITDAFHADRWDYVFTIKRQRTPPQERRVVVLFDGDRMKSIDAPDLPSENDFAASITRSNHIPHGEPPVLVLTDEQRKALPAPPPAEVAASGPEPLGAARRYPPLESAR
jgi:outer membrane protein assembly factor BamE